jgi:hypothetical protein
MKMFALIFAAALCVTAVPAFAGSPTNGSTMLAQVDVRIGDGDHERDHRVVRDRDHCHMTAIREDHNGRVVVRHERHCD